ncbi:MAG: collagen-like protein [Bacteroidetes bacterium]|nr:collagen-like protein [Bacteroidota bacterium]
MTGATGATGTAGTNGVTGTTGATGTAGTNGVTGATGATGTAGTNGVTGATGATGTAGTNGVTGVTGATGTAGTNGVTGATGATGTAGTNGVTGATGATGTAGTNGVTGATGATGTAGTNGVTGATGATGTAGTNGVTGATGATGMAGTNGVTGATGATGTAGTNGVTGATGATGTAGTNGITGATGATGTAGTNGVTGATGAAGTAGTNGVTGATGETGATGIAGTNGVDGATGATGPTGADGATGTFGIVGTTGQTIYHDGTDWIATSNLYNDGANIGIGVVPTSLLHIKGSSDPLEVTLENTGGNFKTGYRVKTALGEWFMGQESTGGIFSIKDVMNDTVRMKIISTGYVGIGIQVPTSLLHVNGDLRLGFATNTNGSLIFNNNSNGKAVTIQSGASLNDVTYTLPTDAPATSGYVLSSTTLGVMSWVNPATAAKAWALTGNSGTNAATDFIGTTDAIDFIVKSNNVEVARFIGSSLPQVRIGTGLSGTGGFSTAIGSNNVVNGFRATALGNYVQANHLGSLVIGDWSGSAPALTQSSAVDQMTMRFNGGYRFFTNSALTASQGIYFVNGGNVGIGTPTPAAALDIVPGVTVNAGVILRPFFTAAGSTSELQFNELAANGANYVGFKAPDAIGSNKIWTLPANDGAAGELLYTNGSGILSWINPVTAANAWGLTGNAGTTPATNFVGTTDAQDLAFRAGGAGSSFERMRILSTGNVGIGTTTPFSKLHITDNTVPTASVDKGVFIDLVNSAGIANYMTGLRFKSNSSTLDERYTGAIFYRWTGGPANQMIFAVKDNAVANVSANDAIMVVHKVESGNSFVGIGMGLVIPTTKLQVAGEIGLGNGAKTGNTPVVVWLQYMGVVGANQVVIVDPATDNSVTTIAAAGRTDVVGVAIDGAVAAGSIGRVAVSGVVSLKADAGGAVRGQHAITSGLTAGSAASTALPGTGASIGVWLENVAANGVGRVLLK